MNSFSIRDIENMCGIKAHTLRIWEQRYQFPLPKRKSGNHRFYGTNDLKYILRIAYLYHHGHKISRIIHLPENEICALTMSISAQSGSDGNFINELTAASVDFDQENFEKILHNAILQFGFEKCFTQVVFPFLYKIGDLWLTGRVMPAHEHFASAMIVKKMHVAINGLPAPATKKNKTVIIFSPRGEMHEIPLLFMWYSLKKNNVNTVYFGTDTGLKELEYYCQHKPATHLYTHLITHISEYDLDEYLAKLSGLFSDKQIVVSGKRVQNITCRFANVRLLRNEEEIFDFAREN
jgi:methanogenic corrinoid protein MtbC1